MSPLLLSLSQSALFYHQFQWEKKLEPKSGDIYKVSAPKLYIKMKQLINAKHFLVSMRSGLGLDYSEVGTKVLQNVVVKFHSHLLMREIKAGVSNFPR